MTIIDNGDIVRAVGFVAIYGAYLEDRIAVLIDMTKDVIPFKENINLLSTSNQAKHLRKELKKAFNNNSKNHDLVQTEVLKDVESHLKRRHVVIHSTLTSRSSRSGGYVVTRKNRRTGITKQVKSHEIVKLANDLFKLQSKINGLKFPVRRLVKALSAK